MIIPFSMNYKKLFMLSLYLLEESRLTLATQLTHQAKPN